MSVYTGPDRRIAQRDHAGPERRRGGRPRLRDGEDTVTVSIRMPVSLYEEMYESARGDDISAHIRHMIAYFVSVNPSRG